MKKPAARRGLPALAIMILAGAAGTGCLHDPIRRAEMERNEAFEMLTHAQRLKDQGDYLLARDVLLRAAETSERPVIYYEIANTHYLLSNPEQAEPYYVRALELAPDYELAQAELDLVRLEIRRRQLEEEQVALERAASQPEPATVVAETDEAPPAPEPSLPPASEPEPALEVVEAAPAEPAPTATPRPTPTPAPTPVATETPQPVAEEPVERAVTDVFTEEQSEEAEVELDPEAAEIAEQIPDAPEPDVDPTPAPISPADAPARASGGAFGGIARAFGAATTTEAGLESVDLDTIDLDQARRAVFPELTSETDLPSEQLAARARASQNAGRFDEAARRWERYLAREPEDMAARLALAESFHRSGRVRRAEEAYLEAVRVAPEDPEAHFAQGNFRVQTRSFAGAELSFRRALELDPDHLRARNNLGAALLQAGRPAEASAEFRTVLERDDQFGPAWLNLALALDDLGRPAQEVLPPLETYARLSGRVDPGTDRWLRSLRRGGD